MLSENDDYKPPHKSDALEKALDLVSVASEHGLVVVPSEPTELMIRIGSDVGNVSPETVRRIYKAMLYAIE